jgi:hypothetical protein
MFDHMDGAMRSLGKKKTQWKDYLFLVVKLARQKLPKDNAVLPPTAGMLFVLAHILDSFGKLQWFRQLEKGMDIAS